MKNLFQTIIIGLCLFVYPSINFSQSLTDTIFDRSANESFAFGADISWGGGNLRDKNGVPKDLLTILEEQGLNSVRYRVWYPENGPSGKNEVVRNAKEAHERGFRVMIDFHYSDSWADPGKQYKPAAWEGHTVDQLVQDVYDHTYDVLDALKKEGVTPEWVQIGNETKRGMLWPEGNTNDTPNGMNNFARMINGGYDAIKAVDSTIQAIVHLPDADENSLYRWMFDGLKKNGAKWDIIGMSAYPRWAHLEPDEEIRQAVYNMKDMINRYDTKVMVVETGHYWYEPYIANNFLVELMDTMMTFGGLGCFWWEPQAMFGYELTAWDPATRQPTIAMDAYLGIKHRNPASVMRLSLNEPMGGSVFQPGTDINISATAIHQTGEIDEVSFYANDRKVATLTEAPFDFKLSNLGTGNYIIYATASDKNGFEVTSEEVSIQVGLAALFQENSNAFCGITNNAGTIDSDHENFTGSGFINTNNESGATINWSVDFKEAGTYWIEFRYAATSNRPGKLTIGGKEIGTLPFTSTGAWTDWEHSALNYSVSEPISIPISLTATSEDGLPNIDYLNIKAINTSSVPVAAEVCIDQAQWTSTSTAMGEKNSISIQNIATQKLLIIKNKEKIESLKIYRIDGSMAKSISQINANQISIPYNDLKSGLYLVQIGAGKTYHVQKFIVKN